MTESTGPKSIIPDDVTDEEAEEFVKVLLDEGEPVERQGEAVKRPDNPRYAAGRWAAYADYLEAQLAQVERALQAIAFNAESFHKGEDGKERALSVIAGWARDPSSVPEGVGALADQGASAVTSDGIEYDPDDPGDGRDLKGGRLP